MHVCQDLDPSSSTEKTCNKYIYVFIHETMCFILVNNSLAQPFVILNGVKSDRVETLSVCGTHMGS